MNHLLRFFAGIRFTACIMSRAALFGMVLLSLPNTSYAASVTITAEQWSIPRNAERILGMEELRNVIKQYNEMPERGLIIYHPFGDEGLLWAEETRSWLVALGIPSNKLVLELDSGIKDEIRVEYNGKGVLR